MADIDYDRYDLDALDILIRACEAVAGQGAALIGLRNLRRERSALALKQATRSFDGLDGTLRDIIAERAYVLAEEWRDRPTERGFSVLIEKCLRFVAPVLQAARERLHRLPREKAAAAAPTMLSLLFLAALAKDAPVEPISPPIRAIVEEATPVDPSGPPATEMAQTGIASWYGSWHHGKPTATGVAFDMNALTAAHRSLPLDSRIRVTNLENGKTLEVKVNDRGPYVVGRVLDLSAKAAEQLEMKHQGLARVKIERVE
jgi:rare lipoprotein A